MTKYYAVIGTPIIQSRSPLMHKLFFAKANIRAVYEAVHVKKEELSNWIEAFRRNGGSGFNVTMPHKIEVMNYVDKIDKTALICGCVNTVHNVNGKLIGYNTDGFGFLRGLLEYEKKKVVPTTPILLIGAGGAARGIYHTLEANGFTHVVVANRTLENGKKITENAITIREAEKILSSFHVIINATSVGMDREREKVPLMLENLNSGTLVSDIIYNPLQTKLLQMASERGAFMQSGIDMFVYQGAFSFKIWTGKEPNVKIVKKVILQSLK